MPGKKIYLVDISSYLFRAYYAIQNLKTSQGIATNATYGVITMLLKLIREKKPDSLVIVFDSPIPTHRKKLYPEYKANRAEPPEDLPHQFDHVREFVEKYPLQFLEAPGFEADDLIATVVRQVLDPSLCKGGPGRVDRSVGKDLPPPAPPYKGGENYQIVIVSSDKDLMQLIGPGVVMYDSMRDKTITDKEVFEKFGVAPSQVADVLALSGDASDNIPGVSGIGDKTASKLIAQAGSLEKLLENLDTVTGRAGENLRAGKKEALLSKGLVLLRSDATLPKGWKPAPIPEANRESLNELYRRLELRSLAAADSSVPGTLKERKERAPGSYALVTTKEALQKWVHNLKKGQGFSFDTETTGTDPMTATLVGLSFSDREGEACYIPIAHDYEGCPKQLSKKEVLAEVGPLLADASIPKWAQNAKYDIEILAGESIEVAGLCGDTLIASYLLSPEGAHNLDHLAREYLGFEGTIAYQEVVPKGKTFAAVDLEAACRYSAEDADLTFRLATLLHERLKKEGLWSCYEEIDLPLVSVLARMERNGVSVNVPYLNKLSKEFEGRLVGLEKEAVKLSGVSFNLGSPKQVSEILFGKLNLPPQRKTKTGYSTDVDVLTVLARLHPLPKLLLEHRLLSKLTSTYVDQLPALVNPKTGRIHTSYNQAVTATGRLSSSDPNLQNIPIRSEEGRRIREAFTAPKGFKLVSVDYSQIELRLLAAFSKDPQLVKAFEKGEDIHRMTAMRVFGKKEGEVTDEFRSMAKTINFGILYGQSPFGLSQMLEIPQGEAKRLIDQFYAEFPSVLTYKEKVLNEAKKNGEVRTWQGRRRLVPEINSQNGALRQNAERTAFNTVFQGSAADLIKVAMIRIDKKLSESPSPPAGEGGRRPGEGGVPRMLLQVHDELIFEVPEKKVEEVSTLVSREMEKAIPCDVSLKVDIGIGNTWADAH